MNLYLQFGYGMMEHCRFLIADWGKGTVILSPRDLKPCEPDQLQGMADDINGAGGHVLLDPQFYLPHTYHERLQSHEYWPKGYESGDFWGGDGLRKLLTCLLGLHKRLGCSRMILPGLYADPVDDDWLIRQAAVFEVAAEVGIDLSKSLATVALSADAARNDDQVDAVLEAADAWPAGGVYLVLEHPNGEYLVQDASWLTNAIDLASGFRLKKKKVVLGYCNQQMLIAACASVSAVASGTWMNVRYFPPDKFRQQSEDEIKKRTKWYYCPQALSEFKIPILDIARRQGVLERMRPPSSYGSTYADILFHGPQPSTVGFTEQAAFRHYLHCFRHQVRNARQDTFDQTVQDHRKMIDDAEKLLTALHAMGVTGAHRDFGASEAFESNRAALCVLEASRGAQLRRYWTSI